MFKGKHISYIWQGLTNLYDNNIEWTLLYTLCCYKERVNIKEKYIIAKHIKYIFRPCFA